MVIEKSIARVQKFARLKGLGPVKLARLSGVSASALRHFQREGWSPNVTTLRKLEAVIPEDFDKPEAAE